MPGLMQCSKTVPFAPRGRGLDAADPRMTDIVQAGKLRIGVFPSAGKPRGLAPDIATALSINYR